jgi:hypothetical protein
MRKLLNKIMLNGTMLAPLLAGSTYKAFRAPTDNRQAPRFTPADVTTEFSSTSPSNPRLIVTAADGKSICTNIWKGINQT